MVSRIFESNDLGVFIFYISSTSITYPKKRRGRGCSFHLVFFFLWRHKSVGPFSTDYSRGLQGCMYELSIACAIAYLQQVRLHRNTSTVHAISCHIGAATTRKIHSIVCLAQAYYNEQLVLRDHVAPPLGSFLIDPPHKHLCISSVVPVLRGRACTLCCLLVGKQLSLICEKTCRACWCSTTIRCQRRPKAYVDTPTWVLAALYQCRLYVQHQHFLTASRTIRRLCISSFPSGGAGAPINYVRRICTTLDGFNPAGTRGADGGKEISESLGDNLPASDFDSVLAGGAIAASDASIVTIEGETTFTENRAKYRGGE